ncbi:MAG: hypothetical protein JEY99_15220 [Spirochaetales bacterium]|nr:hypothetical protein [Spirochaetales bacterium]
MNKEDRELINRLLEEIFELRGEMKTFKAETIQRLKTTEHRCEERQKNPETCTTGRSLSGHLKNHKSNRTGIKSTLTIILECGMLAAVILIAIFK